MIRALRYRTHESSRTVNVITALEEAYGISISNDEMMILTTMKSIVEFTERMGEVDQHGA